MGAVAGVGAGAGTGFKDVATLQRNLMPKSVVRALHTDLNAEIARDQQVLVVLKVEPCMHLADNCLKRIDK